MAQTTTSERIAQHSRDMTAEIEDFRDVHGEPVAELPSMTVFSDEHGYELNEIADEIGVSRQEVSEWMHSQAKGIDHDFSHSDPIVLLHD